MSSSQEKFPRYLKSTLDFHVCKIAEALNVDAVELDGAALVAEILNSDSTMVAWSLSSLSGAPRDPLYYAELHVGGKTSQDPAQYVGMEIASAILHVFQPGASFDVMDYSSDPVDPDEVTLPTQVFGTLVVIQAGVHPYQHDRLSGLRMVGITLSAIRYV